MSIIQVPRQNLIRCLTAANTLKSTYDAVLLKVSNNKLAIATPALNSWLWQEIDLATKNPGLLPDTKEITRTAPLKSLLSIAKTGQTDLLQMDFSSPNATRITAGAKYSLSARGYSAEHFPQKETNAETLCSIETRKLAQAISKVRFAPDNQRAFSTLWRLKIDPEESKITITYTNGYLMFHIQETAEICTDTPVEIILDTDCAPAIRHTLQQCQLEQSPRIDISVAPDKETKQAIVFRSDSKLLYSVTANTAFPDVDHYINRYSADAEIQTRLTMDKADLEAIIKRVLVTEARHMSIKLDPPDTVIIAASNRDIGDLTLQDYSASVKGKPLTIGLNPHFLLYGARQIDAAKVTIGFINQNSPFRIKDANVLFVAMPVMTNETEEETEKEPEENAEYANEYYELPEEHVEAV